MLNLIIVLLLPVILLQALWVRKKTAVLPEPDGERVLTSADSKLLLTNNVLVIGDSAAAGVGSTTQMGALTGLLYSNLLKLGATRVTLHAKTGFKSEDVLNLLHEIPAEHFSSVLLSIGVNDVTKFVPLKRWRQNIDGISALLSDKFGCETVLFTALPPIHCFPALPQPLRALLGYRARLLNQALAECVTPRANADILYVTALNVSGTMADIQQSGLMAADGFHPSTKGYEIWAHSAFEKLSSIYSTTVGATEKGTAETDVTATK
ncbi:SGNH/GDSL hydrolase family protein [Alteromonas sp. S015]|uniref:SGNH/GDSL hydrolase family protein n=1 Tax=Alteromonas sp. S015 TaxID=3117401 RepID=UPI002FE1545A